MRLVQIVFALLVTLLVHRTCTAQDKLMFIKSRNKVAFYTTGDVISFKINGRKEKITDTIRGLEDSLIVFKNYKIGLEEISHLYVDENTIVWFVLKYKYERLFLLGGLGYLALDIFNMGEISEETLFVSGGLVLAGVIAHVVVNDTMKIKGKRRLAILRSPRQW